jgi:hypothetical protein
LGSVSFSGTRAITATSCTDARRDILEILVRLVSGLAKATTDARDILRVLVGLLGTATAGARTILDNREDVEKLEVVGDLDALRGPGGGAC